MPNTDPIIIRRSPPLVEVEDDVQDDGEERVAPAVRGDWFSSAVPGPHRRPAYRGQSRVGMD